MGFPTPGQHCARQTPSCCCPVVPIPSRDLVGGAIGPLRSSELLSWEQLVGSSFHQPLRKPESRAFREGVGGDGGVRGLKNICLTTLVTSWGPHPILVQAWRCSLRPCPTERCSLPSLFPTLSLSLLPPSSPACSSTAYKAQFDQPLRLSIVGSLGTQASCRWAQLCHGCPCQAPGQTDTGRLPLQLSPGKGVAKLGKRMDGLTGWMG